LGGEGLDGIFYRVDGLLSDKGAFKPFEG